MVKSDKEPEEMEKDRDIWQEVMDGVREIRVEKGKKMSASLPPAVLVRKVSGPIPEGICQNSGGLGPDSPGLGTRPQKTLGRGGNTSQDRREES